MDVEAQLGVVDRATLTPLIRQTLRSDAAELVAWRRQRLTYTGGVQTTGGVYRLSGTARAGGGVVPWSLILKVVCAPGDHEPPGGPRVAAGRETEVSRWDYWKREPLAYRSGLLEALPGGLAAPRCFAVADRGADAIWLWLEDVTDSYGGHWPLDRYGLAARHIGHLNGAQLSARPLPAVPWLTRGFLRDWCARVPSVERLWREATWRQPRVRGGVSQPGRRAPPPAGRGPGALPGGAGPTAPHPRSP